MMKTYLVKVSFVDPDRSSPRGRFHHNLTVDIDLSLGLNHASDVCKQALPFYAVSNLTIDFMMEVS